MVIGRSTGFHIWGFDNIKTYRFNVKVIFLMLESFHDCLSEDLEIKILGE